MRNRLLIPVLGAPYGKVLEDGELRLAFDAQSGSFDLRYYEHRFPIDPREYPRLFASRMEILESRLPPSDPDRQDFESLLGAFARLPARDDTSDDARLERYRDKEANKRRLARLCQCSESVARFIAEAVAALNGRCGNPASFDLLDVVLAAQAYRLSYWRVAADEINYRRFFDVNHLAGSPGPLPGNRIARFLAGGPGQPAPRRLRASPGSPRGAAGAMGRSRGAFRHGRPTARRLARRRAQAVRHVADAARPGGARGGLRRGFVRTAAGERSVRGTCLCLPARAR